MRPQITKLLFFAVLCFGLLAAGCVTVSGRNSEPTATDDSYDCTSATPSPIGQSISATFEIPYETVMTWFCDGYSFENILIALETSEAVDVPPETLLQMLLDKSWEEIWVEIGFTDAP